MQYPFFLAVPNQGIWKVIDAETYVRFVYEKDDSGFQLVAYESGKGKEGVSMCIEMFQRGEMIKATEREFLEARTSFLAFAKKLEEAIKMKENF